jgi:hypothetical protein
MEAKRNKRYLSNICVFVCLFKTQAEVGDEFAAGAGRWGRPGGAAYRDSPGGAAYLSPPATAELPMVALFDRGGHTSGSQIYFPEILQKPDNLYDSVENFTARVPQFPK